MKPSTHAPGISRSHRGPLWPAALAFGLAVAGAVPARGELAPVHAHEHHHHAEPAKTRNVSEARYALPEVAVTRMDGSRASLAQELDGGGPVILNFIYTSCTAICPASSQVFSRLQDRLAKEGRRVSLVSISIDPEYDTPARLTAYARRFGAAGNWQFYTGSAKDSIAIQKAFDVYRGDKMNHLPVTFLRAGPDKPWVRVEGMVGAEEVLRVYRGLGV